MEHMLDDARKLLAELELDKLAEQLMARALEHSQADRGGLVLEREGRLGIEVLGWAGDPPRIASKHLSLKDNTLVSPEMVRDIAGVQGTTVLGSSRADGGYQSDILNNDVESNHLCVPLIEGERFLGILYLRKNTASFSGEQISDIQAWAPFFALAVSNAVRFEEVRKAADKAKLDAEPGIIDVEAKEMSPEDALSNAQLAAYVLHKVGNIVNCVLLLSEELQEMVAELNPERLQKANDLWVQKDIDLADFFTNDPKGKMLPEYYFKVVRQLGKSYDNITDDMQRLVEQVHEARAYLIEHGDSIRKYKN